MICVFSNIQCQLLIFSAFAYFLITTHFRLSFYSVPLCATHMQIKIKVKEWKSLHCPCLWSALSGMTLYKTAEWHPGPDPHPPSSLFHNPLSPLGIHSAPQLLPLFSPKQTEKGKRECTLLFTASFPPSLILTPLLQSLTPLPLSALGKQRSDPALFC